MIIKVEEINNTADIRNAIKALNERKKEIIASSWENHYKPICENHYTPFFDIIRDIEITNWCTEESRNKQCRDLFDIDNLTEHIGISDLISKLNLHKYELPYSLKLMACAACCCRGCTIRDNFDCGTCENCKENNYANYSYECAD